jgi:hypothetical protein
MVDAGNGLMAHYYFVLEDDQPGTASFTGMIMFHKNDSFVFGLWSQDVDVTIDKIDPIGGFIEATYSGTFTNEGENPKTFTVTGKIKAKRVSQPIIDK